MSAKLHEPASSYCRHCGQTIERDTAHNAWLVRNHSAGHDAVTCPVRIGLRPHEPVSIPSTGAEDLARFFHETYEALAPSHGWETQERSRTDWDELPAENRALMLAVAQKVLDRFPLSAAFAGAFSRVWRISGTGQ